MAWDFIICKIHKILCKIRYIYINNETPYTFFSIRQQRTRIKYPIYSRIYNSVKLIVRLKFFWGNVWNLTDVKCFFLLKRTHPTSHYIQRWNLRVMRVILIAERKIVLFTVNHRYIDQYLFCLCVFFLLLTNWNVLNKHMFRVVFSQIFTHSE